MQSYNLQLELKRFVGCRDGRRLLKGFSGAIKSSLGFLIAIELVQLIKINTKHLRDSEIILYLLYIFDMNIQQ